MSLELWIRYIHFISIFTVVGTIVAEHMLLDKQMSRNKILKLARIDGIYGLAAILVVLTGLAMWLWVGKNAEFYSQNPVFHIKFTLFIVLGILSVFPTLFFLRNRKGDPMEQIEVPRKIFIYIRIELLILIFMPLLAVMIARGIGF